MLHALARMELLVGPEGLTALAQARIAVFGIGGVGSWAAEALVRAGICDLTIIDYDRVCRTNLNRQLMATQETIGQLKVDALRRRLLSIFPDICVHALPLFYLPDNADTIFDSTWTYILDAMDNVTAKIDLIVRAQKAGIPILSCMGTANKMDPSGLEVTDLSKTDVCPLAKILRKELRRRGVRHVQVIASREPPLTPRIFEPHETCNCAGCQGRLPSRRSTPGTFSFVPPTAGMLAASVIVRNILQKASIEPFYSK